MILLYMVYICMICYTSYKAGIVFTHFVILFLLIYHEMMIYHVISLLNYFWWILIIPSYIYIYIHICKYIYKPVYVHCIYSANPYFWSFNWIPLFTKYSKKWFCYLMNVLRIHLVCISYFSLAFVYFLVNNIPGQMVK